jgi:hypothetical protein
MRDPIMSAFLRRQDDEARRLSSSSDLVSVEPLGSPADRFLVRFSCRGLVRARDGAITEADAFAIGIWFPDTYLRAVDPIRVLTWLGPPNVWHPNISMEAPVICVGRVAPGTPLVDLIYQCWEIVTWNKVTMREDDALNIPACPWARQHLARLPIDRRPLRRRALDLRTTDVPTGNGDDDA